MEKFLVIAHFGDKTYADGGIALVRDSETKPKEKEIIAVGPWSGSMRYIVEEWPPGSYKDIKRGEQLKIDDSVWDAIIRLRDTEESDSKRERQEAIEAFEKLIGPSLVVQMHLAGAF